MTRFNAPSFLSRAGNTPAVFNIAPSRPFLKDIAAVLLADYARAPLDLADVLILLPTRRAVRHLRDAFAQISHSERTSLLPRIQTIGDLDDADIAFIPEMAEIERGLAPAIPPLLRRIRLAQLVHACLRHDSATTGLEVTWQKALDLADALAQLLDSFYTEQIDPEALKTLVDGPRAQHWEKSAVFLDIIVTQWPLMLEELGYLDPADRRRRLIDALGQKWDRARGGVPPPRPVIIAGSTGSMPAVARLMRIISDAALGAVVLPGLDTSLETTAWNMIDDPHPQSGLKQLLDGYFDDLDRNQVLPWPSVSADQPENRAPIPARGREQLIGLALRPAEATDDWLRPLSAFMDAPEARHAISGFYISEAENENDEATHIALLMREALETPAKTCFLVTPDRTLGRRVALKLRRWGINLDDSAGLPFANSLRGNFLRLCAAWLSDVSNPVGVLSLLKHPLSSAGFDRQTYGEMVGELDLALREVMPGEGFEGLRRGLYYAGDWDSDSFDDDRAPSAQHDSPALSETLRGERREALLCDALCEALHHKEKTRRFAPLIDRLEAIATPFPEAGSGFAARLAAHIAAAQALAATPEDVTGEKTLWSHADGAAASRLISDIHAHISEIDQLGATAYPDLFSVLISGHPVRNAQTHPRLAVLGPLEARLVTADRLILGGLNDGIWPQDPGHSPFMSRPMRTQIGLPSAERRVGLSAHDFAQLACQKEVFLTRAKEAGRAPATASRWVIRLRNILDATKQQSAVDVSAKLARWTALLDEHRYQGPVPAPRPTPPAEARPRQISVTSVEKLMRDPYSIYAKDILRLRRLEPVGANLNAAQRGRLVHAILAAFTRRHGTEFPTDIPFALHRITEELMQRLHLPPAERGYLAPLLAESYAWFDGFSRDIASHQTPALIEHKGAWEIPGLKIPVTLTARVDRIDTAISDTAEPGAALIYDYKSGTLPSLKEQQTLSPQLALTALIVGNGGFETLGPRPVEKISYLKVLDRARASSLAVTKSGDELKIELAETHRHLVALLDAMYDPQSPYLSQPRPQFKRDYGDYDHLARRGEWAIMGGDGHEGGGGSTA